MTTQSRPSALHTSNIASLPLLARGKVRDNYAVGDDRILMVASDRLSAFDVIMGEPIPGKGELLIAEVAQAREAHALMKRRIVTGLSIGYWVRESSYDEKTGIRTLTKLDLVEISLVTFPANDDARVEAVKFKLAHGELPTEREMEKYLREVGFSKTRAAGVVAHGLTEMRRRESERDTTATPGLKALSDTLAGFKL